MLAKPKIMIFINKDITMINTKTQDAILDIVDFVASKKITHLYPNNNVIDSNLLNLRNQKTVNFGSCSYLGLEFDSRLQNGSINGVLNYGSQFSISRAYMSCPLYKELEENFRIVFGKPCVITPTTTLGHISAIPVLIGESDAIILDHQVHSSVQMAVQMIKSNGVNIQMIRHNRMDMLEDRIKKLRTQHKKIWYMADGIYSMYGDKAPLDEIYALMEKYPELHFYVDDAHGMSCFGSKGEGYVLGHGPTNDRTVVSLSLAKGFGSGGAVFVFPNEEWARKVQCTGLPMITSGPIQPSVLGASIESSKIHLSSEILTLQEDLQENIKYTNILLKKNKLPLLHSNDSPIFFIGAGLPKTGRNIVNRMMDEGVYQNLGVFPAVPIKNTGIRFTITRLHTFEQIEHMIESLAYHYPLALEEEKVTLDQVCKNFKLATEDYELETSIQALVNYSQLSIKRYPSISEINTHEWDSVFSFNGQMQVSEFELLERAYQGNPLKQDNWDFNYVIVKSPEGKVVIAAPVITMLQKDDVLHSEEISQSIERFRKQDPYYLTSRVVITGSPITIGRSIYVDTNYQYIDEAIDKFTAQLNEIQLETNARSIMLRDFDSSDEVVKLKFQNLGFFKLDTLRTNVISDLPNTMKEYVTRLSKNSLRHIKRKVHIHADDFTYNVSPKPFPEKIKKWYELYKNVASGKNEINVFTMPFSLFSNLVESGSWEIHEINTKPSQNGDIEQTAGVLFIHCDRDNKILTPNYIGLDSKFRYRGVYQQLLYNVVEYAINNKYKQVDLGATAQFEKSRLGAEEVQQFALCQVDDHYNASHIEAVHRGSRMTV